LAFGSGGEVKNCDMLPLNSAWEARWKECCRRWYGDEYLPRKSSSSNDDDDAVVFRCDTFSKCPGLTICTTVYAGFITTAAAATTSTQSPTPPPLVDENASIRERDLKALHRCCFLVIGQEQTAQGLPPVVWMFDKLMGTSKNNKKSSSSSLPRLPWGPIQSFYTVEQEPSKGRWNFRLDSSMEIEIQLPSELLLKSLPVSKSRAEAQGSAAITKTIQKAGLKGMRSVHEAFLKYHRQHKSESRSSRERTQEEKEVGVM